jgi:hypothetical protein
MPRKIYKPEEIFFAKLRHEGFDLAGQVGD